jgi:DNA-binding protein HU-beta
MNKGELIHRLSGRLGDQKTSSQAVDAVVSEIESAVSAGEKVNITGFGVFEKRERAARTARNPRTGEPVKVKKTTVPAFRPGASFKTLVAGGGSAFSGGQSSRAQPARASRAQPKARGGRQSAYAQAKGSFGQSRSFGSQPAASRRSPTARARAK